MMGGKYAYARIQTCNMLIPTVISLACAVTPNVLPEASDYSSVILQVGRSSCWHGFLFLH